MAKHDELRRLVDELRKEVDRLKLAQPATVYPIYIERPGHVPYPCYPVWASPTWIGVNTTDTTGCVSANLTKGGPLG